MKKQTARDKAYDSLGMLKGKESTKKASYPGRLDEAVPAKKGQPKEKPGMKSNAHYMAKAEIYNKEHKVGKKKPMKKK